MSVCAAAYAQTTIGSDGQGIVLDLASRLEAQTQTYASAVELPRPINFGIVAFTRPSPNEAVVDSTVQALRRSFGEENVRVREYTMTELAEAIRNEDVDIFIASAGFYWRLVQSGAVAVASLASSAYPDPNHGEGSSFVVRADSDIHAFADMKGKKAAASSASGFTGYLIPMGEVHRRDFSENFRYRPNHVLRGALLLALVVDVKPQFRVFRINHVFLAHKVRHGTRKVKALGGCPGAALGLGFGLQIAPREIHTHGPAEDARLSLLNRQILAALIDGDDEFDFVLQIFGVLRVRNLSSLAGVDRKDRVGRL